MPRVVGLLLAAGSGERFGGPKALVRSAGEPWVVRAVRVLRDGGCDPVVVVVGAAADAVEDLLDPATVVVRAEDWATGMGASLRAGLETVTTYDADAVLVHLVDLPDVGPAVVRRLVDVASTDALARARYGDAPGHPVLLGRDHWAGAAAAATGDRGARDHLAGRDVRHIDCSDLANGEDVDEPGPMLGR